MRRSRGDGRAARRALGISLLIASSALCLPTQGALECSFSFERVGNGPDFRHATGATGAKHLPESMGAGAAWLDYDGDGWLDLYLVQSGAFPPKSRVQADAHGGSSHAEPLGIGRDNDLSGSSDDVDALYRNSHGALARRRVAGSGRGGYGQGALAFDADGDGDIDLHLTGYGGHSLLVNEGGGVWKEVPLPRHGVTDWTTSSSAGDLDGDGDLDLFVARYLDYSPTHDLFCEPASADSPSGQREYCDPSLFSALPDLLLLKEESGFVISESGLGLPVVPGKGLGVIIADLDGDHRADVYVANDLTPNHLFASREKGFEDLSLLSGAAVNGDGKPEAGMGIAVFDSDSDGDLDLAVTNFDVETNTLYRNEGALFFSDVASISGFGLPSFNLLGFGIVARDFDLDGDVDVYVANGHVFEFPARDNVSYAQPDLLLAGDGKGRFAPANCTSLEGNLGVSRGAAAADYDNDGDIDVVVTNNGGAPDLYNNRLDPAPDDWLGVELLGNPPNTQAIGAWVSLLTRSGRTSQWLHAGGSYLSSSDRRLVFAARTPVRSLEVRWPDGQLTRHEAPEKGRYLRIRQPDSGT